MGEGGLFGDVFGSPEMREVFSDRGLVQRWLDAEAALARAEAKVGLVPADVAEEISAQANAAEFDLDALREARNVADHPLIPTVHALTAKCTPRASGYVHWGATSQDIMDTGAVLQLREALVLLEQDLRALGTAVGDLARAHRATPAVGRTHGQHAVPITFGLKAASWLTEVDRHLVRLVELRPRVLVGQLGGAAGTLASLGEAGIRVRQAFCDELGLARPSCAWHSARDGLVEAVLWMSLLAGTCSRIAREFMQLQRSEIAEVEEAQPRGKIGSSTMPQKRNPMTAEEIIAAARLARSMAAPALEIQVGEHERDMSSWGSEWWLLPQAGILTHGALSRTVGLVDQAIVRPEAMRRNLDMLGGLPLAEAVMMRLAPTLGRGPAHELLHDLAREVAESGADFVQLLRNNTVVGGIVTEEQLTEILDPMNYLGSAIADVDATVCSYEGRWGAPRS
ncbi:MAG: class-II fumarase/aspartase family protein [Acidimicrobiales bacterium]